MTTNDQAANRGAIAITDHIQGQTIARDVLGDVLAEDTHPDIQVAMVWRHRIDEAFLNRFPKVTGVVRCGVGYDNIDLAAMTRHGIVACNNPAYGVDEVADTALAMIMGLARGIYRYDAIASGLPPTWQANLLKIRRTGVTTVGVVGAGRIGGSVLLKLRALGFHTVMFDPYLPSGIEKMLGCRRTSTLEELLDESDIVSMHAPLTTETAGLVDRDFLARMRPGAYLVNTARGGILASLDDIADALESGHLGGVGLDVLPKEPPQTGRLIDAWRQRLPWIAGRCIINPHTAYFSAEAEREMHRTAAETAHTILRGVWPPNVLNPEVRDRWEAQRAQGE